MIVANKKFSVALNGVYQIVSDDRCLRMMSGGFLGSSANRFISLKNTMKIFSLITTGPKAQDRGVIEENI